VPSALAALAVLLWAAGVVLYLITAAAVLASLLHFPVRPAVLSPASWVFMGAAAISVLAGLSAWRHLAGGIPLRYEPGLWSMVFPLGMYCVASEALGRAVRVPWLVSVGHLGSYLAFTAWVVVFAAMLAALVSRPSG
jgi:tellurite resistance protein TehA-like permease